MALPLRRWPLEPRAARARAVRRCRLQRKGFREPGAADRSDRLCRSAARDGQDSRAARNESRAGSRSGLARRDAGSDLPTPHPWPAGARHGWRTRTPWSVVPPGTGRREDAAPRARRLPQVRYNCSRVSRNSVNTSTGSRTRFRNRSSRRCFDSCRAALSADEMMAESQRRSRPTSSRPGAARTASGASSAGILIRFVARERQGRLVFESAA